MTAPKQPTFLLSLIPIIVLILLLSFNVILWKDNTLSGANQMALLMAASIAAIIAWRLGMSWSFLRENIVKTIGSAMPSILILLLIGSLSGTWLISGVVPAMIYYGLDILHPKIFLFASVIITALVSLATGSSWSTVATIGIALIGIGKTQGFDPSIVAGAILSGAYFGDKMSPLSDTTNLAPAMAGTDLFTHIRYMSYTTVPTISITLVIFLIIGFFYSPESSTQDIMAVKDVISENFNLSPFLFIVPAVLIFVIIKKMPPLPALMVGVIMGGIFAVIFQGHIIEQLAPEQSNSIIASYVVFMQAMFGDIQITTSSEAVNKLFSTGGMAGMLLTIWLIISAMIFGGIMEASGMLKRITDSIIKMAKTTGSLVTSTAATCVFFNITASDQYISLVVPGRMFAKTYEERGLKPEVLSRTLEDSGTVTSVLIPWNTCGATQARVLGVSTFDYAPYVFFSILSPIMTILFAYFNIKIRRITDTVVSK